MNFHKLKPSEFLEKVNQLLDWDWRILRVHSISDSGYGLLVVCEDNLLRQITLTGNSWTWLDSYDQDEPEFVVPDFVSDFALM